MARHGLNGKARLQDADNVLKAGSMEEIQGHVKEVRHTESLNHSLT
jgi:hypothetical protein